MKSLFGGGIAVALTVCLMAPLSAQTPTYSGNGGAGHRYPTTQANNYQFGNDPWKRPGYVANHMPAPNHQQQTPAPAGQQPPTGQQSASPSDVTPATPTESMAAAIVGCSACGGAGCGKCMSGCNQCGGAGCGGCRGRLFGRHILGRAHRRGGYAGGAAYGTGCANPYDPTGGMGYRAAEGAGYVGGYGSASGAAANSCGPSWFGSVGGMYMRRDNANTVWLSFDTASIGGGLLGSRDAEMDWAGGMEARVGRYLGDGTALEAVYWGVFDDLQEANAYDPAGAGALNTTFAFQGLDYQAVGNPILGWFDGAIRHRLLRSHEFHNIELNLLSNQVGFSNRNCGTTFTWIAGLRYFKSSEGFEFWSDDTDAVFTGDADEVYLQINVENHLIGFQIGGQADFWRGRRWNFYTGAKIGLYANHITHRSFVGGASGAAFVNDVTSPYNGFTYDVRSNRDDIAMMGELDLGMNWQMTCNWSAQFGYRAVGIAGMALATNQIPPNFSDIGGVNSIDANGHMILHGAYLRATFNY